MSDPLRFLSPESRRWTFAIVCGFCALAPRFSAIMNPETAGDSNRLVWVFALPFLMAMLLGYCTRAVTVSIFDSLAVSPSIGAPPEVSAPVRWTLFLSEWAVYTFLSGMVSLTVARWLFRGHSIRGAFEDAAMEGAAIWFVASIVSAIFDAVRRRM